MTPADLQMLAEVLRRGISSGLSDLFVACPCEVVTYDPITERGDLRPFVRRAVPMETEELGHEELPIAPSVPIMFPSGGGLRMKWPIVPGDVVMMHASTYNMGQWLSTGKLSDAGDVRQHHLGSCWAYPHCHAERVVAPLVPGGVLELGVSPAPSAAVLGTKLAMFLGALLDATAGGDALVFTPPTDPDTGLPMTTDDLLSSLVKLG